MLRRRGETPPRSVSALAMVLCAIVLSQTAAFDAEARQRTRMPGGEWRTGFSTIVVDGKTGDVIESTRADELRHPASLTKVMTLYLLFSEIETGRLKLNTKIKISAEAAAQPPSKLGLKAGDTIEVEQAIKALITRSANDIAVAVSEIIAGDEDSFAELMTQRARRLGMKQTVFKNASGLPHVEQVTTARDMALLALAIQDRFPKLYPYFSTRSFAWRGTMIGNHNRLLGSVEGVDGIKTGYTNASGFNLITNVKRGERHIVGVVLGGRTGAARDEMMRDLISENIRYAYNGPRKTPRFVERPAAPQPRIAAARNSSPVSPDSSGALRPNPVRSVQIGKNSEIDNNDEDHPRPQLTAGPPMQIAPIPVRPSTPVALAPNGKRVTFAAPPASNAASASAQNSPEVTRTTYASTAPFRPTASGPGEPPSTLNAQAQALALNEPARQTGSFVKDPEPYQSLKQEAPKPAVSLDPDSTASISRGPWKIQIGAFGSEEEAKEKLGNARGQASGLLAHARAFTEKTYKGSTQLFRARFAGLDEASAKRACDTLKKNEVECFATRN